MPKVKNEEKTVCNSENGLPVGSDVLDGTILTIAPLQLCVK